MIDAVTIANQRVGEAGKIDEPVPVGVVAGKPRHLEAEHEANAGHGHLGGEPREAGTHDSTGAGKTEVLVNDDNALLGPAELPRPGG
jgi:hypothetical protein